MPVVRLFDSSNEDRKKRKMETCIAFWIEYEIEKKRALLWIAPHLLDSMIYYLRSGVFYYAKRGAKQTVYTGIQENGYRGHDGRKTELSGNSKTIWCK